MLPWYLRGLVYLGIGVTGEILFTAIQGVIFGREGLRLQGFTQLWVFPIYFFFGLIVLEEMVRRLASIHLFIRFVSYAIVIITIEYFCGALIYCSTGICPWEYKGLGNVHGFISLTHLPFWGLLGMVAEVTYRFLKRINIKPKASP